MMSAKAMRDRTDRTKYKIRGKTFEDIKKDQNREIKRASEKGRTFCISLFHKCIYDVWEPELKEYYINLGYSFKPVGYRGGVWQESEYICW